MHKAVLFDLDGTLVHTQIDFRGLGLALAALAHEAGLDWEEKGCAAPVSIEGAATLLSALRQESLGIGIVTRNCRRLLGQLALPYDTLIAREDTVRPKPFPDPVLVACAKLGCCRMMSRLWATSGPMWRPGVQPAWL
jgi:beta-phosphoglucomutase-like phosphatase (HAD superfamily)